MIGANLNQQTRFQISMYQRQIDSAVSAYSASKTPASLVSALKQQAQLVDVLLKLSNLSDTTSSAQLTRINSL
jgi:hypothetical protein